MTSFKSGVLIAIAASGLFAAGCTSSGTVIRAVRVFDGERVIPRADVLIEGARIVAIVPAGGELRGAVAIDGSGKTLLPGLIDAHTHAFHGSLAQALRFGVTTELDMFSMPSNLTRLRKSAESDNVADVRSAGVGATMPKGHPIQIMGEIYGPFATIDHAGQAKAFVAARIAEGSDYLKIVIDDGSVSGQRIPSLAPDVVTALVAAGRDAGLRTIAHVATAQDAIVALDAGIDGLAHIFTDTGPQSTVAEEIAKRAAAKGVFVIAVLSFTEVITGSGAGSELLDDARIGPRLSDAAKTAIRRDLTNFPVHPAGKVNAMHAARAFNKAGVPLLAGTDANDGPHGGFAVVHGASLHRELVLLTEVGMTPVEALAAATSVPARLFGLLDRGRIAPGLRADLLLVAGDPTTDITATRSIVEVWRRGVRQTAKSGRGAERLR